MSFELWLAFTIACTILTLVPGPSVLLVISQSIVRGRNAALVCILGDIVGGIVLMGLSFAGVGLVLAASAVLFQTVKWAGVFYLGYLGFVQLLEARRDITEISPTRTCSSNWGSFWAGALTAVLNPKAIVFYLAFLSQFIEPERDFITQVTILTATSSLVVAVLLTCYALIALRARSMFQSRRARRRLDYAGGTCMIGGSAMMAFSR